MIDIDERIRFYLGEDASQGVVDQIYFPPEGPNSLKSKLYIEDSNRFYVYNYGEIINNESGVVPVYVTPLRNTITNMGFKNKDVMILAGDASATCDQIDRVRAFTKVRRTGDTETTTCILKDMNKVRHWETLYKHMLDLTPFKNKIQKAYWRGATTGHGKIDNDGTPINFRAGNRFDLIKNNFNKWSDIDIAFSKVCQIPVDLFNINFKGTVRSFIPYAQIYKHKYILSVEGNDKDSGINWKLRTNSVVLMAKPTINSWLMESKLQPGVHYVQLADDFSDLREKIDWCNDNQDKCEEIIHNAHVYMSQFQQHEQEKYIEESVIRTFLNNVNWNR